MEKIRYDYKYKTEYKTDISNLKFVGMKLCAVQILQESPLVSLHFKTKKTSSNKQYVEKLFESLDTYRPSGFILELFQLFLINVTVIVATWNI